MNKRLLLAIGILTALGGVVLGVLYYQRQQGMDAPANALLVLKPYRHAGTWVFDDDRLGLVQEPFVSGIPEMIDKLVADIPEADQGFRLTFSARPFPGHEIKLVRRRQENDGTWYYCEQYDMEGWLCPALFKYYDKAPAELYAKADAL